MINLLCPTRGRPDKFQRMLDSANDTAEGFFSISVYVDEDDRLKDKYPSWVSIGRPMMLGPAYQYLYEQSDSASSDIIMMCADDLIFKSKGWDTRVKELMPSDGIGLVSYDDLGTHENRKEDGHPFIGRKFIETIGYLCHPLMNHSLIDNWLAIIARKSKRYFYSDISIEHAHPKYDKASWDETYSRNTRIIRDSDADNFRQIGKIEIPKAVEKINAVKACL